MIDIDAYPLQWPATQPRTAERQRSRFETTLAKARTGIVYELAMMGVRPDEMVISTDIPLRRDGGPIANRRTPDDPGVAVYFIRDGQQLCMACDKWDRIQDNMRGIEKSLEAIRGLERWGSKHMVDAAFIGFAALPATAETGWWVALELPRSVDAAEVERRYRALVKRWHPDMPGGDVNRFRAIQDAYTAFRVERGLS